MNKIATKSNKYMQLIKMVSKQIRVKLMTFRGGVHTQQGFRKLI